MNNYDALQESTSGYTEHIDGELASPSPMPVHDKFGSLGCFYVSPHGHTRLFHASRYGKSYVLKCLKADYLYTPVYRQALVKEFEIGLQLDHPGICRTIGMEDVEGLGPAIVMERVDGCTLKELIGRKGLTKALGRKLAAQAADAVDYMHSKQVIHRDLKPSNIMVTHNGHNVKLIDFSLADGDAFMVLKQPAGTSGYIAPELLQRDAKTDMRADVYSFGMVMRDIARSTGDKRLLEASASCTRRDAAQRPASLSAVTARALRRSLGLPWLACLAAAAVAAMVFLALAVQRQPGVEAGLPVDSVHADGNKAVDYMLW